MEGFDVHVGTDGERASNFSHNLEEIEQCYQCMYNPYNTGIFLTYPKHAQLERILHTIRRLECKIFARNKNKYTYLLLGMETRSNACLSGLWAQQ